MSTTAVFLVGPPGVGKTAVARALMLRHLRGHPGGKLTLNPSPKWTIGPDLCAAGHYDGSAFDGADTVPYSGARAALEFWAAHLLPRALTIFDGDRFSDRRSFEFVQAAVGSVRIVLLEAPEAVLAARRAARGSRQNPAWMKGRATKATRFAELDPGALRLDATVPSAALLEKMIL